MKTAAEIQALQAEWKTIGPVGRGHEKAIWERFRAACDRFFTRRQEDLKQRKDEWAANLARKEALCDAGRGAGRLDRLGRGRAAQLKQLQAEWKTIGPVRKSKSEAVWQRFRTACDRFFDRYKHRDQLELQEKAEPRDDGHPRARGAAAARSRRAAARPRACTRSIQDARARWQQAPELPREVQQDLAARYHQALGAARGRVAGGVRGHRPRSRGDAQADGEAASPRSRSSCPRRRSRPAKLSPAELLAQQWRERLAANTMTGGARPAETEEARVARRRAGGPQRAGAVDAARARAGEVAGPLNERFQRACRRFYDQRQSRAS